MNDPFVARYFQRINRVMTILGLVVLAAWADPAAGRASEAPSHGGGVMRRTLLPSSSIENSSLIPASAAASSANSWPGTERTGSGGTGGQGGHGGSGGSNMNAGSMKSLDFSLASVWSFLFCMTLILQLG